MINYSFVCSLNVNGACTFSPPYTSPTFTNNCRNQACPGYLSPSHAKVITCISKIEIAHTPLTVPSEGPHIAYFKYTDIPTNIAATGVINYLGNCTLRYPISGNAVINLLSEWYSDGHYPPMLNLDQDKREKWGCIVDGRFQAQANGVHKFFFAGDGMIDWTLGATHVITGMTYRDPTWVSGITSSLTSGIWYDMTFAYMQTNALLGGYTVMVQYPGDAELYPVTAGMYTNADTNAADGSMPLLYNTVTSYSNLTLNQAEKSSASMSFQLPMSVTSGYGYSYNYATQILSCLTVGSELSYIRKGDLIKCSMGYLTNNTYDYITSFVGHVVSITTDIAPGDQPIFTVECEDFTRFINEALMINYPTYQTYWLANLMGDDTSIYGYQRGTPAFDAWPVNKMFKVLMTHAGIDSTLLNKKYEFLGVSGNQILGTTPLIIGTVASGFPVSTLERFVNYGNPNSSTLGGQVDSEYNFKYGFGEQVVDVVNELADNFGFVWGFRPYNNGAPYLSVVNAPIIHRSASSLLRADAPTTSGTWTKVFDMNAIGGYIAKNNVSGSTLSYQMSGSTFYAILPNIVYTGTNLKHVNVTVSGASVISWNLDLNNLEPWQFYNGIDPSLGANPTIYQVASGLPYGNYTITIKNICSGSEYVYFNSFLGYERDVLTPVETTTIIRGALENTNPGNLTSLHYADHSDTMRNDIVVVGKSKGIEARSTPTNAQKYYYVGRGMDLDSIYNPQAINFIGRQRSGMIVNNRVTSDERANFLAYSVLSRYRMPGENVSFDIVNNLRLELGDAVKIVDDYSYILSGVKWIKSISQNISTDDISTSIDTNDLSPYGSVIQKPQILITDNVIIRDFAIENAGFLTTQKYYNGGFLATKDTVSGIPLTTSLYPDATHPVTFCNCYLLGDDWESFVISGYSSSGVNVWGTTRMGNVWSPNISKQVLIPYDPYTSEDGQNTYVNISFNVLRKCKMRVDIVDANSNNIIVATLTGDSKASVYDEKYFSIVEVGSHVYSWNGLDHFGTYNKMCPNSNWASPVDVVTKNDTYNGYGQGTPEAGMYVSESVLGYGKFQVKITYDNLEDNDVKSIPTIYPDIILTRRGIAPWDITDVLFWNERTKYYNTEAYYLYNKANADINSVRKPSITNFDNDNQGLGITIHSTYHTTPTWYNQNYQSFFAIPRTFTYLIKGEYHQLTAMAIKKPINQSNGDLQHTLHYNIAQSPNGGKQGELQQFPIQASVIQASDNPTFPNFNGRTRTNYWLNVYFDPTRDDNVLYKTHAGSIPEGYTKFPNTGAFGHAGYDFYAWLIVINLNIQDLSGRCLRCREYFTWLGDLDGKEWDEFTGNTPISDSSWFGPLDPNPYIGGEGTYNNRSCWQGQFFQRTGDSYSKTDIKGGADGVLKDGNWATAGDTRFREASKPFGMFYC